MTPCRCAASALLLALVFAATCVHAGLTPDARIVNKPDIPEQRHENAFCHFKGKLAVIGGRGNKNSYLYNDQTGKWEDYGTLPMELHHFQCVALGRRIVIGGALTGQYPTEKPASKVWFWKVKEGKMNHVTSFPSDRDRGSTGTFVRKGKIYFTNGNTDGHGQGDLTAKTWFDEYTPKTKTWKKLPSLNFRRDHGGATYVRKTDSAYVLGGRHGGKSNFAAAANGIKHIEVYSFATGKWSVLANQLVSAHPGMSPTSLGNLLYIANGELAKKTYDETHITEAFSVTSGKLRLPGSLPKFTQRHGTGLAVCNGAIWTAVGAARPATGGNVELAGLQVMYVDGVRKTCVPDSTYWG